MELLLIGGTGFLGRHLVEAALARGHRPTLFHRGRTRPELFPELEHLRGDRDGGFALPPGRRWDAAIDTCGYVPRVVGANARVLAGVVERLCFVSSISVHADFSRPGLVEEDPVATLDDPSVEEVNGATYGALKALCERACEEALSGRVLVVRPGVIVGPGDGTDRLPWWVERTRRGGDVLAPDPPGAPVQLVDARDLAAWTIAMLERGASGTFHVTGPAERLSFGELLETCRDVAGSDAHLHWVDGDFLVANGIHPWTVLPLWTGRGRLRGVHEVDVSRALEAGLVLRPLEETVRDVLAWLAERPPEHRWRTGLSPAREEALLAAWNAFNLGLGTTAW